MHKNNPAPSNTVGSPSATAAIGNRWTQCRGSHLSPLACLLHVDAQVLKQAAEAAPSQTTLHRSYRFHIASPRPIMSTSGFSPGHRALPRIFANPKESQLAEITQLLFQSGSKTTPGRLGARVIAPIRVAFRHRNDVGTQDEGTFAAQWLAYALPCQRFANTLAGICA